MKMWGRRPVLLVAALCLLLIAAGCGGDQKVGSGVRVGKNQGGQGAIRDENTTSTVPPTTATTRAAVTTTTRRSAPTTVTTAADVSVIKIQDDEQGDPFDPRLLQTPAGRTIEFRYVGTKTPRQVQGKNNEFRSPMIPPGGSFRWTPRSAATIQYIDTTRPYSFGEIQVY